jgi:hypothetical protein
MISSVVDDLSRDCDVWYSVRGVRERERGKERGVYQAQILKGTKKGQRSRTIERVSVRSKEARGWVGTWIFMSC